MTVLVLGGCHVLTMNPRRDEHPAGTSRSTETGSPRSGPARCRTSLAGARRIDASGCLATPGLVNTHHHLYQWATRGRAVDATLFDWLTELYPVWARIDEQIVRGGRDRRAGLAGPDRLHDQHGPPLRVPAAAAATCSAPPSSPPPTSGLRFHPTRGSMDLGASAGGLPPDDVVEDLDTIMAATQAAIERYHDPSPGSMLRIGVAPCSPFSVTSDLLAESAALARSTGIRLHTHLAETADEDEYCAGALRLHPGRVPGLARLAGPRRLAGARRAPRRRRDRPARRDRHRRRALPVFQRPARRGHLPDPRAARRGRAGRPRRGRRGLQRGQLAARRGHRRDPVRPRRPAARRR